MRSRSSVRWIAAPDDACWQLLARLLRGWFEPAVTTELVALAAARLERAAHGRANVVLGAIVGRARLAQVHAGAVRANRKSFLPEMAVRQRGQHVGTTETLPHGDVVVGDEDRSFALMTASAATTAVQGNGGFVHGIAVRKRTAGSVVRSGADGHRFVWSRARATCQSSRFEGVRSVRGGWLSIDRGAGLLEGLGEHAGEDSHAAFGAGEHAVQVSVLP